MAFLTFVKGQESKLIIHGEDYLVQLAVGQWPRSCIHHAIPSQRSVLEEPLDSILYTLEFVPDRKSIAIDERPSVSDEDLGFVASHLRSLARSRSEFRWGDTTSYTAKKK